MFGRLGLPELIIVLVLSMVWLVPLAAGVWALVMLYRIRRDQATMMSRLDTIERRLPQ